MKHQAHIYNELKEITPFLAEVVKTNVFYVPENYFSSLDTEILKKINPDQFEILPASKPPSFTVPDGYFESLAGNILQKIKNLDRADAKGELKQLSPILFSAQNENIFTASGSKISMIAIPPIASVASASAYAALTPYVEILEVESLGDFGDEASTTTFTSLRDNRVRKLKGARDAGTISLVVAHDALDVGQQLLRASQLTPFSYAFKIEANDKLDANDTNSFFYFKAKIMSQRSAAGAAGNVWRDTSILAIDSEIFEIIATVVP